jgi:hypothetical protein
MARKKRGNLYGAEARTAALGKCERPESVASTVELPLSATSLSSRSWPLSDHRRKGATRIASMDRPSSCGFVSNAP